MLGRSRTVCMWQPSWAVLVLVLVRVPPQLDMMILTASPSTRGRA
jgi:hypothetical protein